MNYLNIYYCEDCDEEWDSVDDCMCNDKCPGCNKEYEPVTSAEMPEENTDEG